MKQNRGRSAAVSVILIACLLLILLLNSMIFVQGPYLREKDYFYQAHQKVMEQMRSREGELLNRYALSEVTYISRIHSLSRDWIVWYDQQGKIREQIPVEEIDYEGALNKAHQLGVDTEKTEYGWIGNRAALLYEDKNREVLLDAKTLDLLMDFEKR